MHSFQPSRGRILFEVFCALAVVASMVGAWQQTQASALLTAAAAAGLYAMVRLFDLARRDPVQAEEPQRIDFEAAEALPAVPAEAAPLAEVEPTPEPEASNAEPEPVEPAIRASAGRRKGGSRKGNGRRASAAKAKVVEFAPVEVEQPDLVDVAVPEELEFDPPMAAEAPAHVPHAPLFEPEPFVRMPRAAFGRRGQI